MSTIVNELILEQFLALQRRAILTNLIFAAIVILIGIGVVVYLWMTGLVSTIDTKVMGSIGGAVVSSLSGFRISEIMQRKERITVIRSFQAQLQSVDLEKINRTEKRRIEEVLWRIAEKSITG